MRSSPYLLVVILTSAACTSKSPAPSEKSAAMLQPVSLPMPPGLQIHSVRSIRGSAADDVWLVADAVRDDRSARERYSQALHFDGHAWLAATLPARTTSIAAASRNDAWAVGRSGSVAHWDGRTWTEAKLATDVDLLDVAVDAGQAWVAASEPSLQHFDGTRWEVLQPEPLAKLRVQKVFAIGGQVFVPATWQGEAAVARFDGKDWQREVAGQGGIIRLAGTGPDDLWGFGMNGQAFHKDGKGWTASQTGSKSYPIDAWAAAPDDVWLVGDDGMIQHFDGKSWTSVASGTHEKLWSVWAAPGAGPVFIGGDAGLFRAR